VTPFDPAFLEYTRVARTLAGNPHVVVIDDVVMHPLGGYTVLMERLEPVDSETARQFFADLRTSENTTAATELLAAIEAHRSDVPLFAGYDTNPTNVLRRPADGTLVLTDAFWINGPELWRLVTEDPAAAIEVYSPKDLARWAHLPCMNAAATARILAAVSANE
jgi:hypothetical protein